MGKIPENPEDFSLFFILLDQDSEVYAAQSCPRVNIFWFHLGASLTVLNTDFPKVIQKSDTRRKLESSTDQRQEQTHMLESQAASLASLQQCCTGQATDQARFSAQTGPVLKRLGNWMTSWQIYVVQQCKNVLQQNSYNHDNHSKGQKEPERFLIDGIVWCKLGVKIRSMATIERLTMTRPLVGREPEEPGLRGCNDLVRGSSGVRRVGGEEGYHTRYCHQGTSRAGWTVGAGTQQVLCSLLLACMLR